MSEENSAMDYSEHRRTFAGFTKMVKISVISSVIFGIFYFIFVIA